MLLMLLCSYSARKSHFSEIQAVCDGRTDRQTDGRKRWEQIAQQIVRTYVIDPYALTSL